jgi:membrane protein YqaA with SNARE-associated domain
MMRRVYDWTMRMASHRRAPHALFWVSFAESSVFPIPPDVMLIPMVVANPAKAWLYATVCTAGSVLGGILGYAIGYFLYETLGQWVINTYGLAAQFEAYRAAYNEWGLWIILIKGLTPIPYKLVTIASGFAGYNFWMFVLLSFVARGMRFYLLAFLLNRYGPQARIMLEERLGFWVTTGAVVLVIGIIGAVYLF